MNKGFAFVTYKSMEDVARVLQSELTVDGRPLSIKLASQQDQGAAMKRRFCVNVACCFNATPSTVEARVYVHVECFTAFAETALPPLSSETCRHQHAPLPHFVHVQPLAASGIPAASTG